MVARGGGGGIVAGDGGAQRLLGKRFGCAFLLKGADIVARGVVVLGGIVVFDLDEPIKRAQLLGLMLDGLAEGILVLFRLSKLCFQLLDARFERVVFFERTLQGAVAALDLVADRLTAALIH